jgi:hypothetical protein
MSRLSALEEAQRIRRRQVSLPKAGLPPWCVPDRQECDVELAVLARYMLMNDSVRVLGEGSVAREENRMLCRKQ